MHFITIEVKQLEIIWNAKIRNIFKKENCTRHVIFGYEIIYLRVFWRIPGWKFTKLIYTDYRIINKQKIFEMSNMVFKSLLLKNVRLLRNINGNNIFNIQLVYAYH